MIKAVIFDLDHTLFDRHGTLKSLVPKLREEFAVSSNMSDSEIGEIWCYADDHFVYSGWESILSYLSEKGIFDITPPFSGYRAFLFKHFAVTAIPFPETIPMLEALHSRGIKTGLITNGDHNLQYAKIGILGLEPHFDEIIATGDYGIHKPDRAIFDIMREKLGFSPDEMVYVGDNPVNDIEGARGAGWKTVWIKSTGYWDNKIAPAHREVYKVNEIIDAILSLEE